MTLSEIHNKEEKKRSNFQILNNYESENVFPIQPNCSLTAISKDFNFNISLIYFLPIINILCTDKSAHDSRLD